jgi:hypothetical protein
MNEEDLEHYKKIIIMASPISLKTFLYFLKYIVEPKHQKYIIEIIYYCFPEGYLDLFE